MERATPYSDFIVGALPQAVLRALEAQMAIRGYEYQSELVRKWVQKGREEGREEGRAASKAEDILAILAARGLAVSPADRRRILACTDIEVLGRWVVRAATAANVADLLD